MNSREEQGGARGAEQIILAWTRGPGCGLVVGVLLAVVTQTVTSIDLSAYPRWLVVLVATLVVALAVWLLTKLLKLTLWLLLFGILVGGFAWAGWELLHRG